MNSSLFALNALNFFMADVAGGLGPFLGVFLQARHWSPAEIGAVMTIGGIAGMAVTTPLGALVDRTRAKRAIVVAAAIAITLASIAILLRTGFVVVAGAQVVNGIAGAAVGPAIAAITLGLVHQRGYPHQLGRNGAFNHSGNVAAAALAGTADIFLGLAPSSLCSRSWPGFPWRRLYGLIRAPSIIGPHAARLAKTTLPLPTLPSSCAPKN
jgi:MFS family permease